MHNRTSLNQLFTDQSFPWKYPRTVEGAGRFLYFRLEQVVILRRDGTRLQVRVHLLRYGAIIERQCELFRRLIAAAHNRFVAGFGHGNDACRTASKQPYGETQCLTELLTRAFGRRDSVVGLVAERKFVHGRTRTRETRFRRSVYRRSGSCRAFDKSLAGQDSTRSSSVHKTVVIPHQLV